MDKIDLEYIQKDNPLFKADLNDLDWLELENIPNDVDNPLLLKYGLDEDPFEEVVDCLIKPEYLHFAARILLNVELPPYQLVALDMLWNKMAPMLIASRGGAKSFLLSVYCALRLSLEPGAKIVAVGAGLRQSRQVYEYMKTLWENSPILRDIAGKGETQGPRQSQDRFEFRIGNSVATFIPIGDGSKIRGLRANYVIADEFGSINPEVFDIVVRGFASVASTPMQNIKERARIRNLKKLKIWNDSLEANAKKRNKKNQIVYSGTPTFYFNHFYKYYKKWETIIKSKGDSKILDELFGEDKELREAFDWQDYAVIRIPYNYLPEGMMATEMIAQAKANLPTSHFLLEYCACFVSDSDGFYRRSIIEAATTNKPILVNGKPIQFSILRQGISDRKYVIGIDPAADDDNAALVILELYPDHRRIVHCWTTNRKKYNQLKKKMLERNVQLNDDYYSYIARKIRQLMSLFPVEKIVMDQHGGGRSIAEALASKKNVPDGEFPIFEEIDLEDPKPTDIEDGLHILQLIAPNADLNSDANHGMLKDIQEKVLLFPLFDTIELAKSIEMDNINSFDTDTYEDLLMEIEELKTEMTLIVPTSTPTGKEHFDTPAVKSEGMKRGTLRKDRFSALLYANYYARNKDKADVVQIKYVPLGGTKEVLKGRNSTNKNMYTGPGLGKFGNAGWLNANNARFSRYKMY